MKENAAYTYICRFADLAAVDWDRIEGVELAVTATGEQPRLRTIVKACWTPEAVRFRFECEDDHVVSDYTRRDEPLYEQDVVEVFVDETGEGTRYMEFEVSPRNVVFDAIVDNDLQGGIRADTSWDAAGLATEAARAEDGTYRYELAVPLACFARPPEPGTAWRVNFYRIDDDPQGRRHYWAWSPTGRNQFHIPSRFGHLVFA